jgi:hypothetical protein
LLVVRDRPVVVRLDVGGLALVEQVGREDDAFGLLFERLQALVELGSAAGRVC